MCPIEVSKNFLYNTRMIKAIHYDIGIHEPACNCGGWPGNLQFTYVPKRVTCNNCKRSPAYKEMMERPSTKR